MGTSYDNGIVIVAENPSRSLRKISEIYDRIAFAGVGRYNEFDQLRVAGIRHADTKGFAFSRNDVEARSLANLYAQYLGQVFTHEMKPLEVEILVAELGSTSQSDQLFHIAYEGTITDERGYAVLGGDAEVVRKRMAEAYKPGWKLEDAIRTCVNVLSGHDRVIPSSDLEVAVLDRSNGERSFKRISQEDIDAIISPKKSARSKSSSEK